MSDLWAVGVDVGGTKIRAAAVDDTGFLAHVVQVETCAGQGPDAVLGQCTLAITKVLQAAQQSGWSRGQLQGVGVASAGRIDPVRGVVVFSTDTFRNWQGTEIARTLGERLSVPVRVDNDVNAALLGEAWQGGAKGCQRAAFVALGTGVGGALLEAGKVVHGANCSAGEFGHMLYQPHGRLCGCGARGCYEAYIAGPALANLYRMVAGQEAEAPAIMRACAKGERLAKHAVATWVQGVAALLYTLQNAFDPECILVGGGMVDSADVWWDTLQSVLEKYPIAVCAKAATKASQAALYGAARMVMNG